MKIPDLTWVHVSHRQGRIELNIQTFDPGHPKWIIRLRPHGASQFAHALITDRGEGLSTPGDVGILYIPRCPEPGDGMLMRFHGPVTDDRRNLTHQLRHDLVPHQATFASLLPVVRSLRPATGCHHDERCG